jgi:hypothetical protein
MQNRHARRIEVVRSIYLRDSLPERLVRGILSKEIDVSCLIIAMQMRFGALE